MLKVTAAMKRRGYFLKLVLTCLLGAFLSAIALARPVLAHGEDLTVAEVVVTPREAQVTLTLPKSLIATADENQDGQISATEVEAHRTQLERFLSDRFRLTDEQGRMGTLAVKPSEEVILPANLKVTEGIHATLLLNYRWREPITTLNLRYGLFQSRPMLSPGLPLDHCMVTIRHNGQVQTAILSASSREFSVEVESAGALSEGISVAIAAAFVWGAAHALSPGHGKTMLGAYLVGAKATPRHALLLGLTTTITHTIGVIVLGLVALFASRYILPEQLFPWLSLISGVLVVTIGINLFRQRLQRQHHHHHHHSHEHLTHTHDPHFHHPHHTHDDLEIHWRSLIALGVSGGLVPCPAALVLLLSTVGLGYIGYGLVLVLVFSLGLALTLTSLGLLLINAKRLFKRLPTPNRLFKKLSAISALVITCIGFGIIVQAIAQLEIFNLNWI